MTNDDLSNEHGSDFSDDDKLVSDETYKTKMKLCICVWKLVEGASQFGRYRQPNPLCEVHFPRNESHDQGS